MIHTDIPPPHTTNRAINIDVAFDIAYEKEVKRWRSIYINKTKKHSCITNFLCCCCKSKKYPSVIRTIINAHGRDLFIGNLYGIQWAFFSLLTPFVVRVLLKNISTGGENFNFLGISNPWILATIIFFSQLFQSIGYNQACGFCAYAGVTMRGSMISAVYRKSLRLTSKSRQISTSGEMVNLMSNDAIRIWKACQIGHFAWYVIHIYIYISRIYTIYSIKNQQQLTYIYIYI